MFKYFSLCNLLMSKTGVYMIREINEKDLPELLKLYTNLHENNLPDITSELVLLWNGIFKDTNHHIIVAQEEEKIVSSCVCVIVPNLTHEQRPYALIENVITQKEYRGRGLATDCLNFAKQIALENNCYKIMLLTGAKDQNTLHFYQSAGFNCNDKTAFIQWI